MKNLKLCFAVALVLALSGQAWALTLVYEEGPKVGQAFDSASNGPLFMKIRNYDSGSLYYANAAAKAAGLGSGLTAGTVIGGAPVNAADIAVKQAAMDAWAFQTGVAGLPFVAGEDSWGIARVNRIEDADGFAVWSEPVKGTQLTSLFWGEKDFRLEQINANEQHIDGAGMELVLYEEAASDYNPTLGSAGRTLVDVYTTVTEGNLIFKANSVGGFLHDAGQFGGPQTQFESIFNTVARTGVGEAFMSIDTTVGSSWADAFNSDFFESSVIDPDTGTFFANADIRMKFTTAPTTTGDWLVTSFDPIELHIAIPEPMTMVGLAMGLMGLGGYVRRRRAA